MLAITGLVRWVRDYSSRLVREERGQGMVEYGLIIALVSIAVIGALVLVGGELGNIFDGVVETLQGTAGE
ncbi:MAG: Flp family type IVb pilin [Thermaerobacterales bacterium]